MECKIVISLQKAAPIVNLHLPIILYARMELETWDLESKNLIVLEKA